MDREDNWKTFFAILAAIIVIALIVGYQQSSRDDSNCSYDNGVVICNEPVIMDTPVGAP